MFDQVLKVIGLAWVLYACYRLYDAFALWILPSVSLKRYQKKGSYESWALVTGASAGIGLGCAQELALCGFNVVLLGHNEDELEDARSLIENECLRRHKNDIAVRILVLDAATSTPDQIEAAVNKMDDLDITVLVNNVGGPSDRSPALGSLHEFTAEEVESTINLNARFMAHLTRLMVPILAKSGPSLMLNVSSTARAGIPGAAVYAGAKGFVSSFSNAIAREIKFEGKKIDVLCLVPGEVDTKSNVLEMRKATIIIAGSGLTGLTFALMMQQLGVDYILLEAYGSCTPNIGASIALQPQGLRVLHQLGLLDDIQDLWQPLGKTALVDAETGKMHFTDVVGMLKERHGHIKEKDRLLVNQKVVRIDGLADRAVVYTAAGDVFEAQMVVGADGVHSAVRREMWRNAETAGPEAIPEEDKKEITCDWATCFGVSSFTDGIEPGFVGSVAGNGWNAGWMGGKGDRTFTFWTFRLPEHMRKCTHNTIPRFTDEDHQNAIEQAKKLTAEVPRTQGLNLDFTQLYDQRHPTHSGITALPHFVLRKWHFGRLVVIGDAAHKFNPLPGQGGMNCVVSAATLVNCLQEVLGDTLTGSDVWDMPSLDKAFTNLASIRVPAALDAVTRSEEAMNFSGWRDSTQRFWFKMLMPLLPNSYHANGASSMLRTGRALKGWEEPEIAHSIPYDDEKERTKTIIQSDFDVFLNFPGILFLSRASA
ncbi:FAD-dependent monooxygenase ctvC [Colletotrichum orbiculare MAFF 240422]|uniref:FAD-dependent monooxygenase ctvC n=1 Tax=Colletotrichum orbiculare (strain 104-T / ATCC 96160 / CBS 514.97 / LARS 414 / MAFF 240422) TaxID=1213857 RepID=A0A484FB13_COLOR|nr:FAD-dependent monooxygenase ctvC [Colletotrichum orbiculare MAFF 240422]